MLNFKASSIKSQVAHRGSKIKVNYSGSGWPRAVPTNTALVLELSCCRRWSDAVTRSIPDSESVAPRCGSDECRDEGDKDAALVAVRSGAHRRIGDRQHP